MDQSTIKNVAKRYFGGSFCSAVSFMIKEKNLSLEDLELLLRELKNKKNNSVAPIERYVSDR